MSETAGHPWRIWCNMAVPDDAMEVLRAATASCELLMSHRSHASNLVPGTSERAAQDSDIVVGQPDPRDLIESKRIRWAHLNTASYTRYDREDVRSALRGRGAALTNSSTVYADPCAQHVLAFMMAHQRRLIAADEPRRESRWDYETLRPAARVLGGQSVLIVGFGSIGARLAELLRPFGAIVTAIRRTPSGHESVQTEPMDRLDDLLPVADHVVNVLPAAAATRNLFGMRQFERMRPHAAFYNVGRGDTVDQDALLQALTAGSLAAAYLDVTTPEPLPAEHPLWNAPNCFITPHIAGGVQDEPLRLVRHFTDNLGRWIAGKNLADRVI